ncbi:MAG: radical SAM/SPASM domain-containing protein [Desulfobacteraceae bacterium]|jgi:MoaA/NifB/PqqE/SkfB family radical SAM enzyme
MFFKNLFKKTYPRLDWIQVEVSSCCNAECIYCPHTEYSNNWQSRLLPVELFRKLIPAFGKIKLVFLQGWGEPFTHPQFMEFLRIAKKAGCMVGTTTNGTMLDSDKIIELIDEGLDIIGFSLAGIDEKNDSIRKGTQIKKVLKCIDDIHRIKSSKSVDNPRIHIAYMLLRSGLADIYKLPAFLKNADVDQTVVSSLSLVVNKTMEKETLRVSSEQEHRELKDILKEIKKNGDDCRDGLLSLDRNKTTADQTRLHSDIAFNIVSPLMEESFCSENIEKAVVIGSDGSVSPCVMGLIPVKGDKYYYFREKRIKLEKLVFGNLAEETLDIVWNKKEYKKFIREHRNKKFVQSCKYCQKRFVMDFP